MFSFMQIKYGDTATSEGVLFATYSALIGESQAGGQHRTRLKQIQEWCKPNFDGVVSFNLIFVVVEKSIRSISGHTFVSF